MSFLLDTNVLSEVVRPRPEPRVVRWLGDRPADELYVSVLTLGEIRAGIERLEDGPKKRRLQGWLGTDVSTLFEERVLPIDAEVADRWGHLLGRSKRSIPAVDALIAATAIVHGLRLATRNAVDYRFEGLEVFDPWTQAL